MKVWLLCEVQCGGCDARTQARAIVQADSSAGLSFSIDRVPVLEPSGWTYLDYNKASALDARVFRDAGGKRRWLGAGFYCSKCTGEVPQPHE